MARSHPCAASLGSDEHQHNRINPVRRRALYSTLVHNSRCIAARFTMTPFREARIHNGTDSQQPDSGHGNPGWGALHGSLQMAGPRGSLFTAGCVTPSGVTPSGVASGGVASGGVAPAASRVPCLVGRWRRGSVPWGRHGIRFRHRGLGGNGCRHSVSLTIPPVGLGSAACQRAVPGVPTPICRTKSSPAPGARCCCHTAGAAGSGRRVVHPRRSRRGVGRSGNWSTPAPQGSGA